MFSLEGVSCFEPLYSKLRARDIPAQEKGMVSSEGKDFFLEVSENDLSLSKVGAYFSILSTRQKYRWGAILGYVASH